MKIFIVILSLVLLSSSSANAQFNNDEQVDLQMTAEQEEMFQEYVENLTRKAEDDDAYAQNTLAELYQENENPDRDLYKAVYWYEKAAENGNTSAALQLGQLYGAGSGGLKQDCELAIYWSTKATKSYDSAIAWNNVAWELVTCPDNSFIDANRALKIMQEHGNMVGNIGGAIDTLAAIHAQLGNFTKAVTLQETALFLIEKDNNILRINSMKKRLKSYQNKTPWTGFAHENPKNYMD